LLLELRQHGSQIVVGELLTSLFVECRAGMQVPVVDKANTAECLSKMGALLFSGIEAILVCTLVLRAHCLVPLSLLFDMLFQRGENFSIERAIVLFSNRFHLFQQMGRKPIG